MTDPNEHYQSGKNRAILIATETFDEYADATTEYEKARAFIRLTDVMSDLKTWHPNYDYEAGFIICPTN